MSWEIRQSGWNTRQNKPTLVVPPRMPTNPSCSQRGTEHSFDSIHRKDSLSALYLCSFQLSVQLKCGEKNITLPQLCFIWIIWLELSCFLNFLQEHMRPLLDIRSVCFSPRHLLIICSFPDTPHPLWWCQNLPHLPQLNFSLSKRWLTGYIQYCAVSLSIF